MSEKSNPSSADAPQCEAPDGTWLWCKLMDWCKSRGESPANYDDLFAIAGEAHKMNSQSRDKTLDIKGIAKYGTTNPK